MQRVVASDDPLPAALARQIMWRTLGTDWPIEAHKVDSRGIFHMGRSPDVAAGIAAFREECAPHFGMPISRDMPFYYLGGSKASSSRGHTPFIFLPRIREVTAGR